MAALYTVNFIECFRTDIVIRNSYSFTLHLMIRLYDRLYILTRFK